MISVNALKLVIFFTEKPKRIWKYGAAMLLICRVMWQRERFVQGFDELSLNIFCQRCLLYQRLRLRQTCLQETESRREGGVSLVNQYFEIVWFDCANLLNLYNYEH